MKVENIIENGKILAQVLTNIEDNVDTEFITTPETILQVGVIQVNGNRKILRHRHQETNRSTFGTSEVLIVFKGEVTATIYSELSSQVIANRMLSEGMVIVLHGGGHSFESTANSVLLEIKNGPYSDTLDKVFF